MVMRSTIEDAHGRVVASRLTGVVMAAPAISLARAREVHAALLLSGVLQRTASQDPRLDAWVRATLEACRRFYGVRLAREEAIVSELAEQSAQAFQPSLFDSRAGRQHEAHRQEHDAARREAVGRHAAIAAAASIHPQSPQPFLILLS